ncbi:hypothetical protein JTB14_023410 [Gonioctena quinquepunctata]|nr:hypothetical protein JTB14_023410 [Gonioctena quinquepunctata]
MKEKENEPLLSGKFSQTFTFQDAKNEGNEVVLNDHIYSKEEIPSSTFASKKKRTVASQRLHPSAVVATTIAEVSSDTLDVQKQYYEEKNSSYLRDK